MKKNILFVVLLILLSTKISAKEIVFTTDQKEYYFLVGEEASVPLKYENKYNEPVTGIFSVTIVQEINQPGLQYSNSNSQSETMTLNEGNDEIKLGFGTSNNPAILKVDLSFSYEDKGSKVVELDEIQIHFVQNESQKQNKQDKQKSKSRKVKQQANQQLQQQLQNMFQNQQQPNAQQKLQNNQLNQDSSALKKQLEQQLQAQKKIKEQFQKELENNKDFQNASKKLADKGYKPISKQLNPVTNNTGDFQVDFENAQGDKALIKGSMENSQIKALKAESSEEKKKLLDQLRQNKQFQKFNRTLSIQGYNQTNTQFEYNENNTIAKLNYNKQNQSATIQAEFVNGTIKKVELIEDKKNNLLWIITLLILAALIGVYSLRKRKRENVVEKSVKQEKPFDYFSESKKLLDHAKKLYESNRYKDAYGKAAQALRLFLTYENGLNKELTSFEILQKIKNHALFREIKECFNLCSLVEFAKYQANKRDFNKLINLASKVISK